MCERLFEHERSSRPHLSRTELLELALAHFRRDNH
jgi:hypothetical protein